MSENLRDDSLNGTRRIKALDVSVINRIAAGEIIIQPANALKELLENSIDANATSIEILVKDGGLKLLQITDNGLGIHKEDMNLLCERFATSKLSKFEDLENIATYGFRGEALASISHISRLSVITKTADSPLAYKAYYSNGKLANTNFKAGTSNVDPKPVAGKDGTQIIVEDLFYNVPSRLKVLKSKSDELAKILDVIGRYAVHTSNVGFSCKKYGESYHILSTRPNLPLKERIRNIFGSSIANELINLEINDDEKDEDDSYTKKYGLLKASGAITSSNYSNKKKIQPVLFINHRLVACDPLKRAVSSVYQFFLPKGNHPFVYISLEIKPQNLDVNIHPTKREVRFLHEDEVVEIISVKIHELLSSVDTSRKFKTQSVFSNQSDNKRSIEEFQSISDQAPKKYRQENKLVRVDAQQSKLNSFLSNQSQVKYQGQIVKNFSGNDDDGELEVQEIPHEGSDVENKAAAKVSSISNIQYRVTNRDRHKIRLNSIISLRQEITDCVHKPLTNIFNNASYVGIVDESRRLCCFQYDVKLFICDYAAVLLEFYYQIALSEFYNYGELALSEQLPLEDILDPLYSSQDVLRPKNEIIQSIIAMKDMYKEYFRINIIDNQDGKPILASLPMILKDINPPLSKLPFFIYRLGNRINYEDEKECLHGILRQIALLYIPESISDDETLSEEEKEYDKSLNNAKRDQLDNTLEHIIFPLIKQRFLATKSLLRDVIQIADLPGLYKVFERC